MKIAFIDLAAQQDVLKTQIDNRIQAVLAHGKYIMGPEVAELEQQLAQFSQAPFAISCANGTDALQLALMALNAQRGDAVFCPSFTFAATAEAVALVGATPVFVDVDPATFNIDIESLKRAILHARDRGLKPAGIIPVDLFGLPADYAAIDAVAKAEKLWVIADAAQSFGATYAGNKVGTMAEITTTSFFPSKPLGCYGDGGALFTSDPELRTVIDSFRMHGKGVDKYDNVRLGVNSRLDTLQAAILLAKLSVYSDEIIARQKVAGRYNDALKCVIDVPECPPGSTSVWAQYTLRTRAGQSRPAILAALGERDIPAVIYYERPLHLQTAYKDYPRDTAGLSNSESLANAVFSLPMHAYLGPDQQDHIIENVLEILETR